jgi:tetratricopeptide (TPR) repeat protein/predicted Ser/Thr protein kinase
LEIRQNVVKTGIEPEEDRVSADRFQQIEELYHAARGRTPEARAALLAQVDPQLRREVESLLAERTDGDFLEEPAIRNAPQLLEDSTLTAFPVGASFGPYRIESKIGEGGMGEVFRAVDTRLRRTVAIKLAHEKFSDRFEREARAIAALNHPHICTLYDVGPNFLVMEFIEGETLAQRLSRGKLSTEENLQYGGQIVGALAAAHAKGIIHRDLKPGNIMLTKSGVKVLDFGLAKGAGDETLTASRAIMGTPAYMAPEQREGKPADARADIYSLGCVLYEMSTGARVGSRQRVHPRALERIVNRCLEEDPGFRWQSVAELARPLGALAGYTPQRKAVAVAALAGLVLAAGGYFYLHRAPKLTDKDTIVLADFTNITADSVFDGTLRQGLSVQLEQSPFLSIISDQQIQQTLQMMGQKPNAKLTPEIAREICQRTSSAAVLDGSIAQIGTPYLLTIKAVNCSNGQSLGSTEAQASDKSHVLDALVKTASEIRIKLGESLSTVQKFDTPLEQATTPSLEALKAYSAGQRETSSPLAISFYKRAVELDPNFAAAYAWLGIWSTSTGEPSIAADYTRKAYELRDHASEPERYFISAIYYKEVPGNLEKAEQTCKLWMQAYPRVEMPHDYLSGGIYPQMGRYGGVVSEAREAIRLKPDFSASYAFLMEGYIELNRFDEAKATYRQALERKLYDPYYPEDLYTIAFLQNDTAGMKQQVMQSAGQAGIEDTLLANEADTAAYFGRLREAEDLTRRAMESAERAEKKEKAATFSATSGLREALFGNGEEARRLAAQAMEHSAGVDVVYGSALALAYAADTGRAQNLMEGLDKRFPEATIVQFNYLPSLRAKLAINRGNASEALETLRAAVSYELGRTTFSDYSWNGLYPVFVRGEAYLAAHQGSEAAAEFQKVLDHRGIVWNSPIGALAHLQLGRAYAMQGETAKAKAAYQDFLALWKDADPDIPVLKEAKAEFTKLQ